MKYLLYLYVCGILIAASCQKKPEYPVEPSIKMKYLTKDMVEETIPTMVNNEWVELEDSIKIVFEFTDGDGDLGLEDGDTVNNIFYLDSTNLCRVDDPNQYPVNVNVFITDIRTGCIRTYSMPYITPEGIIKAISGDMSILLNSFICRKEIPRVYDTLSYEVQIVDRAGHFSNVIQTQNIYIKCN